jgi:hypothetical protein
VTAAPTTLYTIVLTRMRTDPSTRAYAERRTAQGLSKREIIRCLKRYLAREIHRRLAVPPAHGGALACRYARTPGGKPRWQRLQGGRMRRSATPPQTTPTAKFVDGTFRCSFCGKQRHQVKEMIGGPGVYICNECVALCDDILLNRPARRHWWSRR